MAKKPPTSIRISNLTKRQIAELAASTGMNQTEVIGLAVDRLHAAECGRGEQTMKCEKCGRELVFVFDGRWHVGHAGHVNTHNRDRFNAGARVGTPSPSTQRQLAKEIAAWPWDEHPAEQ